MKNHLIISFIIISLLIVGCSNVNDINDANKVNKFAKEGSSTDIKQIKDTYSTENSELNYSIDLQVAKIYHNISSDQSSEATRIIGKIEEQEITAKELEIRALKHQASGSKNPYKNAWDDMKLNIYEQQLAKEYNINVDKIVQDNIDYTRKELEEDDKVNEIQKTLINAYGVSEDEYWNVIVFNGIKRLILHNTISEYLNTNNIKAIDVNSIKNEVSDSLYYSKIYKN
ncbi:hypothetical protein [Sinanaerobacter sp. ZZT-01]|uniref:hypothetical protein n=1 Tax=Sinanaerobacter sp. ZZT-01 TaxID=3111540 RepID=UPI002D79CF0F|nr:hypothetical protein [Sinanaerobacter sp. ZZT-01]WRR93283.1 hypothetical protein U5921_14820 [Sinanaerobacter sp. ZZT-01]